MNCVKRESLAVDCGRLSASSLLEEEDEDDDDALATESPSSELSPSSFCSVDSLSSVSLSLLLEEEEEEADVAEVEGER